MRRNKEQSGPRRPETPWLAAAMLGLTITTLASSAAMFGAGVAIGQAVTGGK